MTGSWRMFSLLVLAAFWTQSFMHTPGIATVNAQNSTSTPSSTTAREAAPASPRGPVQPVPFSHQQHAGTLQMPCESCHAASRSGETVAIPQTAFCMQCHQTMGANNPGVQKLAVYAKSNAPIPWVRVYELPSFVTFSHKTHLLHGATCQQCHGPVAERVQLYKETDISMAACINCHRATQASTDCNTCHMLDQ